MTRHPSLRALSTAVLLSLATPVVVPASPAQAAPVRVMALGDSITGSPGCWRQVLWNRLQDTGYTNVDMVGTLDNSTSCGAVFDGDNEGHGGYLVTDVASQNMLPGWLSTTDPDVVLMHFGTNDVWNGIAPSTILSAFSTLVGQARAANPAVRILVAKIIPLAPTRYDCPECPQRVVDLNAAIPAWAASESTAVSPVTVVDLWTGFTPGTDTGDGVHPNDSGNTRIANSWYPALTAVLDETQPTSTGSEPATSSPVAAGPACEAGISVASSWPGGFVADVSVLAGSSAVHGWSVALHLPTGTAVTGSWNAALEGSTGTVTVSSIAGAALAPGTYTSFGFQGSGSPNGITADCSAS
jgi:lysophospholipase L1-like esterase